MGRSEKLRSNMQIQV